MDTTTQIDSRLINLEQSEIEYGRSPEALELPVRREEIQEQLALYLLQGDVCGAKFLWKRTPVAFKENQELRAIWGIGQALWMRDMPDFYIRVGSFEWSAKIQSIMISLRATVQENMIRLIGTAYSSIRPGDAAMLVGVTEPELDAIVLGRGWAIVDGLIEPKEPLPDDMNLANAEYQIEKLTDFVSVLEN